MLGPQPDQQLQPVQNQAAQQGLLIDHNEGEVYFRWIIARNKKDDTSHLYAAIAIPASGRINVQSSPRTFVCGLEFNKNDFYMDFSDDPFDKRLGELTCEKCKEFADIILNILLPSRTRMRGIF